jgi:hypothetical protein
MKQADGLRATDTISSPQSVRPAMRVKTSAEAFGYSRMLVSTLPASALARHLGY